MILPSEIIIELTKECNLDCSFCFSGSNNHDDHSKLTKSQIFNILKDIKNSNINHVRFTGGEPLLREDLIDILMECSRLELKVILNTNGDLINNSNMEIFSLVDRLLLSFHDLGRKDKLENIVKILSNYNI